MKLRHDTAAQRMRAQLLDLGNNLGKKNTLIIPLIDLNIALIGSFVYCGELRL